MRLNFIAGLPRSGSTLLAAILRQNPDCHAAISGPLADIFESVVRVMSVSEGAPFISDERRERLLRAIVATYYSESSNTDWVFDTNRNWCRLLPSISLLFPASRIICCVRNPAWILDSIERLIQKNALRVSKLFPQDKPSDIYSRVEILMKGGLVSASLASLRQAWFSEHADRLLVVRYDSLTETPDLVIGKLYEMLHIPAFKHDFNNLAYSEQDFDARLNTPGLHDVWSRVEARRRQTILPPELFKQNDREFWHIPEQNPRGVVVL